MITSNGFFVFAYIFHLLSCRIKVMLCVTENKAFLPPILLYSLHSAIGFRAKLSI